jgi:ribosomal protein L11 methyltransferase
LRWIELSIAVKAGDVEAVNSVLGQFGQGGAVIEEWQSETAGEKTFNLKAYLPHNRAYKERKQHIDQRLKQLPCSSPLDLQERLLKPEDWLNSLKQHFGILEIGSQFIIKPSWVETQSVSSDRITIELDPGAAFGTGLHATTRLCLLNLERILRPGMSVFDLGTGSGILSIAAVKLGASSVLAVDIDPVAIQAAKSNAAANGAAGCIRIRRGTLSLRAQRVYREAFDLALANITSRAISDLSGALAKVLKPGGKLVVSGIHPQGLDEVLISLVLSGFTLEKIDCEGQWYAVVAQKPANTK